MPRPRKAVLGLVTHGSASLSLKSSQHGLRQDFIPPTAAPDPLQNFISSALVLYTMLHIVAVQYLLHKQWEEEAAGKGWVGQTDNRQLYGFSKVSHPYRLSIILKTTPFLKNKIKPLCNVHTVYVAQLSRAKQTYSEEDLSCISAQPYISFNAMPFDLFYSKWTFSYSTHNCSICTCCVCWKQ